MLCRKDSVPSCQLCRHLFRGINRMFPTGDGKYIYLDHIVACWPNKLEIPTSRFPNAGIIIEDPKNTLCQGFVSKQP